MTPIKFARLFSDRRVRVVTFTKKDGTSRRMRFRYEGGGIRLPFMTVRDLDKDAIRTLNLSTVERVGAVEPEPFSGMTYAEIKTLTDQMF